MQLISFAVEGDFAAFRDPSVTTNQTVSLIPPKSAVIGIIAAIIGVRRSHSIHANLYSPEYLKLLGETHVGIKLARIPSKITFHTNHRSLKEPKTKPFKTELMVSPSYIFYVASSDEVKTLLLTRLKEYNFVFSPTLGHAYCPARISDVKIFEVSEVEPENVQVSTVILDEVMEVNTVNSGVLMELDVGQEVVVERLLYHYIKKHNLERIVLRHFIPIPTEKGESSIKIERVERPLSVSRYFAVKGSDETLCLY
ncbi:MAG: CRISPR-associated protein Cas5 [Candidatus Bathyarchaeia archaeon]